jgi:hypothetical protein
MHVPKGTIFSIGGDEIPYDRAGRGLTGRDLETFHALYHLLVPLDSHQGRQVLGDVQHAKKLAEDMKRAESARNRPRKYWYERPAGIVILAAVAAILAYIVCELIAHHFPHFLHS